MAELLNVSYTNCAAYIRLLHKLEHNSTGKLWLAAGEGPGSQQMGWNLISTDRDLNSLDEGCNIPSNPFTDTQIYIS